MSVLRIDYINLEFPIDELPDLSVVEQTLKSNPDIALVHTTHNETGTGILNPIRQIGAIAHKYGAVFSVVYNIDICDETNRR